MSDPRQADVWHKKPEVADRTLNERKYCKLCDYYYSEMFTCPICYGEAKAKARIVKLLEDNYWHDIYYPPQERYATKPADELVTAHREYCIGCQLVALIKGETE